MPNGRCKLHAGMALARRAAEIRARPSAVRGPELVKLFPHETSGEADRRIGWLKSDGQNEPSSRFLATLVLGKLGWIRTRPRSSIPCEPVLQNGQSAPSPNVPSCKPG